jgi:hypothetical protein
MLSSVQLVGSTVRCRYLPVILVGDQYSYREGNPRNYLDIPTAFAHRLKQFAGCLHIVRIGCRPRWENCAIAIINSDFVVRQQQTTIPTKS